MKNVKQEVAVIGLGTFGFEMAVKLYELGQHVLAIDKKLEKINQIKDKVTIAVQADATEEEVLVKLDIAKFDKVVLGMSNSLETLILAVTYLKKHGAKIVIAKANTHIQKQILLKVGVDEVIQPEISMARMLARKIAYPNVLDYLAMDSKNSLIEITVPEKFSGKTLRELDLRNKHNILVILKYDGATYKMITNPNTLLMKNDKIFVAGEADNIVEVFS